MAAALGADAVDGFVAEDHRGPGEGFGAGGVEVFGAVPEVEEALLEDILGVFFVVQHLAEEGEEGRREAVVEGLESAFVAGGHALHELLIRGAERRGGWQTHAIWE